jgi:hypothetical protein
MLKEGGSCGVSALRTALHRSPNKLWRSNSIFYLWFSDNKLVVEVFAFISLGIVLLSTFTFVLSTLEEFQVGKNSHIQYTVKRG